MREIGYRARSRSEGKRRFRGAVVELHAAQRVRVCHLTHVVSFDGQKISPQSVHVFFSFSLQLGGGLLCKVGVLLDHVSACLASARGDFVDGGHSDAFFCAAVGAGDGFPAASRFSITAQRAMTSRLYAMSMPVMMISFFDFMDCAFEIDGKVQHLLVSVLEPAHNRKGIVRDRGAVLGNAFALSLGDVGADCRFGSGGSGDVVGNIAGAHHVVKSDRTFGFRLPRRLAVLLRPLVQSLGRCG